VHQPGTEPLEQLALAEHDRRLVAGADLDVAGAGGGLRLAGDPDQLGDPACEQRAAGADRGGERDGGGGRDYVPLAFLTSALIAGRISWRSPITA
jgi:hypothetical protein